MTGARTRMLAELRGSIERIETGDVAASGRVALGHGEADAVLQGGLARGALHEVFPKAATARRRPDSWQGWRGASRRNARCYGCDRILRTSNPARCR